MMKGLLSKVFSVLLLSYCLIIILNIASHKEIYQWDFYVNYESAKAYGNGINPYDTNAVSRMAKNPILPYVYSPITLFFFQIFTKLDYDLAFYVFLILKCILVIGLICLWRKEFLNKQTGIIFYLLCLFAFNGAIYLDLRAGNISILEQFLIWLAFSYCLKHNFINFCALIIITAIFKIQPILFLFLLLFFEDKRKYKYLIGGFTVFGIILIIQWLYSPYLFYGFLANAINTTAESGIINPSTFAFLGDLLRIVLGISNYNLLNKISLALHCIIAFAIILISWLAYTHLKYVKAKDKERWGVFLTCLIYALVNIRFKDYSYILLILPTYFIMNVTSVGPKVMLLFIASIPAINVPLPGSNIMWDYYPLFIAYLIWWLYLYEIHYSVMSTK